MTEMNYTTETPGYTSDDDDDDLDFEATEFEDGEESDA